MVPDTVNIRMIRVNKIVILAISSRKINLLETNIVHDELQVKGREARHCELACFSAQ